MDCPHCRIPLAMSERHGIEIDYCPQCRGVWLDRGELDKIIERAGAEYAPAPVAAVPPPRPQAWEKRRDDDDDHRRHSGHGHHGYPHRKKGGFLGDIFDFD